MELKRVMMLDVAAVTWKLAEYMKRRGITAYELGAHLGGHTKMSKAYRLADPNDPPTRVDFKTLGDVIKALREITNEEVDITDLLEYHD